MALQLEVLVLHSPARTSASSSWFLPPPAGPFAIGLPRAGNALFGWFIPASRLCAPRASAFSCMVPSFPWLPSRSKGARRPPPCAGKELAVHQQVARRWPVLSEAPGSGPLAPFLFVPLQARLVGPSNVALPVHVGVLRLAFRCDSHQTGLLGPFPHPCLPADWRRLPLRAARRRAGNNSPGGAGGPPKPAPMPPIPGIRWAAASSARISTR